MSCEHCGTSGTTVDLTVECDCGYGSADGFYDIIAGILGLAWIILRAPYRLYRKARRG